MRKLYHREIGFPKDLKLPEGIYNLEHSEHTKQAACTDRYGMIKLPTVLDTSKAILIELELENNVPTKGVWRTSYDNKYDIIIVMIIKTRVTKTVWLNEKNDIHKTLKHWLYDTP
jgi:hypothetical protein